MATQGPSDDGAIDASAPHTAALRRAVTAYALQTDLTHRYRVAAARFQEAKDEFEALRQMFDALADHRAQALAERDAIRRAVRAYSRSLREEQVPPEQALVRVKETVHDIVRAIPGDTPLPDAETLEEDVAVWAIQAYFEAA
jgi:hypothetical protein